MVWALQMIHVSGIKSSVSFSPVTKQITRVSRIRCSTTTPKKQYTIAVLPGDGIGAEVTPVAVDALRLAGSLEGIEFVFKEMPIGGAAYEATGNPLPEESLKLLEASSLKKHLAEGVDLMIIRELVGGLYHGVPRGFGINPLGEETGFCTEIYSTGEVDRVARIAFDMAAQRRGKVTSVDKASVMESSMLWRKTVTALSTEYPEVDLTHMLVDTSAMELVRSPKQFDVVVTSNNFGDILSDVASVINGGIGMLPSACIGGSGPQMFEPVHGSAPDIDGQDVANPLAAVLTAVMLLRYGLKEEVVAKRLENAIYDTLDKGFRTRDIATLGNKIVGLTTGDHRRRSVTMMPSTSSIIAGEESIVPSPVVASVSGESSLSDMTQTVHFSSGNPRIGETRGVMHLFSDDPVSSSSSSSSSNLPIGRNPLVCVLGVPNHMTYADFCQFCGSFIQHILEMRTVRNDGIENRYSILIRFDSQESTDTFYQHFRGKQFNSLEEDVCRLLFTLDVQFTGYSGSIDHTQPSAHGPIEQPTCPVCLDRLDQDTGGILTTMCNHSFHCSCISNWPDSSCPVCRYCQQQPENSVCCVCQTTENLWMCVICGVVGCGRYKGGHARRHWEETEHCYSLELETQRVWDYAGDNYVHRLIQSKTDGKLVELNSHGSLSKDGCGSFECSDSGMSDALLNSKVDMIISEYNELLQAQLENQKQYFEKLLQNVKEETEQKVSEAASKAISQRLQKLQTRFDRCMKEKQFLEDLNENLVKNKDEWITTITELEEREKKAVQAKDEKIKGLDEQLGKLMAQMVESETSESKEVMDATTVLPISTDTTTTTTSSKSNRRKG
ncbi:hypothetical protein AALP_AA2G256700 [Arabis alpina]|uniref:3-isopropylmalate dehydrogenase n=1 Tax=Arabis alpina TaxID=50452 RepID=A0A087HJY8_ARAAL|nr:hypothetical protein AALP_AA2G256700 [Arabis alpina]